MLVIFAIFSVCLVRATCAPNPDVTPTPDPTCSSTLGDTFSSTSDSNEELQIMVKRNFNVVKTLSMMKTLAKLVRKGPTLNQYLKEMKYKDDYPTEEILSIVFSDILVAGMKVRELADVRRKDVAKRNTDRAWEHMLITAMEFFINFLETNESEYEATLNAMEQGEHNDEKYEEAEKEEREIGEGETDEGESLAEESSMEGSSMVEESSVEGSSVAEEMFVPKSTGYVWKDEEKFAYNDRQMLLAIKYVAETFDCKFLIDIMDERLHKLKSEEFNDTNLDNIVPRISLN